MKTTLLILALTLTNLSFAQNPKEGDVAPDFEIQQFEMARPSNSAITEANKVSIWYFGTLGAPIVLKKYRN